MKILQISKYPPIQGGVSAECFWLARTLRTIGHDVRVLTNAEEVESEYRTEWTAEDRTFAYGQGDCPVLVVSTTREREHRYIPAGNPIITKLVTRGLAMIESDRPDLIYSSYLEPYGVAGAFLSLLTGIGHAVAHAGSDVARLMESPQLAEAYRAVFAGARAVITMRGEQLGISDQKCVPGVSNRLRSEFFFPKPALIRENFRFGIYGKVGRSKGTRELIDSIHQMVRTGTKVELHARWGGIGMDAVHRQVQQLRLHEHVFIKGFVPHWRIPEFIWSCDAILFLENEFPIAQHSPLVPMEAFMCGRPVLLTPEIANKPRYQNLSDTGCYSLVPAVAYKKGLPASRDKMPPPGKPNLSASGSAARCSLLSTQANTATKP